LYCAVRFLESASVQWVFAAATFTSLTALFEQSKGAGLLLGLSTGFLIIALGERQATFLTGRQWIAIAIGLTWPFLITLIYFASRHALTTMLASWFWPLQHYSLANRVPYAYDNLTGEARHRIFDSASLGLRLFTMLVFSARTWIPYLPLFGVALLIRLTFRNWRRGPIGREWTYYVVVSATISGLLLSIVIARADYLHFIFLQPIFFLVLAWMLDGRNIRHPFFVRIAPVIGLCLSMSLLAMAAKSLFVSPFDRSVATRRGTIVTQGGNVIEYVQAHVASGETILVYPYQSTYYYLTQTYSPTRFDFYQPGMHTREQLKEMLADFSAHPTRALLYEPDFTKHILEAWPNTPSDALTHDVLAEYIQREYQPCTTFDSGIVFMMRNDLTCPDQERRKP